MDKPVIYVSSDDSYVDEIELPTKWEICGRCEGEGKHCNPSIDGNGLTREDFEEDPDFAENYFEGLYDVACYDCGGSGKKKVADESKMSDEEKKIWREQERERAIDAQVCRMEQMYGC